MIDWLELINAWFNNWLEGLHDWFIGWLVGAEDWLAYDRSNNDWLNWLIDWNDWLIRMDESSYVIRMYINFNLVRID